MKSRPVVVDKATRSVKKYRVSRDIEKEAEREIKEWKENISKTNSQKISSDLSMLKDHQIHGDNLQND